MVCSPQLWLELLRPPLRRCAFQINCHAAFNPHIVADHDTTCAFHVISIVAVAIIIVSNLGLRTSMVKFRPRYFCYFQRKCVRCLYIITELYNFFNASYIEKNSQKFSSAYKCMVKPWHNEVLHPQRKCKYLPPQRRPLLYYPTRHDSAGIGITGLLA